MPEADLVEIPADLVKLPALCAPCGLRGVLRPRPEAIQNLNDLVNAEVVVQCHEIDSRAAIPKMIVSVLVDGVDVAVRMRNECLLEMEGDDASESIPATVSNAASAAVDINNNVENAVDLNNNVEVDVATRPQNVDINNNIIGDAAGNRELANVNPDPLSALAVNTDSIALKDENEKLKKQIHELTEKISELNKKYEDEMKKMEKKIDTLKSLI